LNEIQLEFAVDQTVISAYRAYIANLSETVPEPGNSLDNFLKRRGDLFFDLLDAISKAADVTIDRHELDRFAYVPFGWQTEQEEQRVLRASLIEILQGRKALHIVPEDEKGRPAATPQGPYPPPP
jgi:hypothetical protein